MKDIFEAKISCEKCNMPMLKTEFDKFGFVLRAVQCPKCKERIFHPGDLTKFEHYNDLRRKTYNVKLRVVGNSHAVSIPKEIVDFISDMNARMRNDMNDMVKLCFEDFGKISLKFFDEEELKHNGER